MKTKQHIQYIVLNNYDKYYILYKNQDRLKAEFLFLTKGERIWKE
nr:MAG TPA: hypothetical protein [Caudoviricetes sp.]